MEDEQKKIINIFVFVCRAPFVMTFVSPVAVQAAPGVRCIES